MVKSPQPSISTPTEPYGFNSSPLHRVKLDPVHQRVLVDRPGVGGALAQSLAVGLAG